MRTRRIIGWLLLFAGATYGIYKAEPLLDRIANDGASIFGFVLIFIVIILAISRILSS
ncbi:MAG: hypothetical protein AAF242_00540 [Bacteroidota bacterium]